MQERAGEAAGLLRTLANRNRLMLVCTLVEGEFSVGALEERLGIHQPTLSQQLTVLREAGIVVTRRLSKQIFYRLAEAKAAELVGALYAIFCADTPEGGQGAKR
ncbi:MAG: helix-turn-helix transcriptional regulator [Rhizobiales bacterium]|nr:helix-turn-helix transcriptional regulator [Hyphomicrobiales bacterium]